MVAGMLRGQGVSHLRDYICLYDVTAGAVVGRTWILLVQLEGRSVTSNGAVDGRQCTDGLALDRGGKRFHFIITHHLDSPGDAVPGRRVDTANVKWCEDPNQIVRYENVRSCGPLLNIAVKTFQISHSRFPRNRMPIGKRRGRSIVQDDKLRPPGIERKGLEVLLECRRGELLPNDSLPVSHFSLPILDWRGPRTGY